MLLVFTVVLTLYVSMIIGMYDPEMSKMLDEFADMMPEIMAAMGMASGASTLLGFMISYLYGFIVLMFPMLYSILRSNSLVAKYVDRGSMVSLVTAPVKRRTVAVTQMKALLTGIILLVIYTTVIELICATQFPGELDVSALLLVNAGLLCLHFFIGGICFLASCLFSDTKYSIGFGAGVPVLMFVLKMLSNAGKEAEAIKFVTFFSLFNPEKLATFDGTAIAGILVLFTGSIALFVAAIVVFSKKDLHI